jgi:4,5-dihydroxyphthalate decarboxylase
VTAGRAAPPPMHVATLRFDRTAALIDGRVRSAGINFIAAPGGRASVAGFLAGAFDAADIPFARYVFWKQQGRPITAVPVFTDRLFQHEYVYTRTDSGIESPAELRGRRVLCAPSYFSTPSFWHRALFRDDYGLELGDVAWYSAGTESDGMRVPDAVNLTVIPAPWLGLEPLLDGTVDVLMTARTAMVPAARRHEIRRVMHDAGERRRAWAKRTGCFPILHVLAIRNESLAARPGFDVELCRAFDEAKQLAYRTLQDERMSALPFMRGFLDDTVATWGDDPWPYGVEPNRPTLERFLDDARDQGLTNCRLHVEELFTSDAAARAFTARMTPGAITGIMDGGWAPEPTYPD